MIWVENGILADFQRALGATGLEPAYDCFPSATASLQAELAERLEEDGHAVVLLRSSRSPGVARSLGPSLSGRVRQGTLRLAYWGEPSPTGPGGGGRFGDESREPPEEPLPALFIPPSAACPLLRGLLTHLTRAGIPGIHSVLPEGATIITEKLSTEFEIGRKLDKILGLALGRAEAAVSHSWVMRARLAVSSCLVQAFEDCRRSGERPAFPRIQLGISDAMVAFSVRWRAEMPGIDPWLRLAFHPSPADRAWEREPWRISARFSDALLLQLLPDAREVEVVMLIAREEPNPGSGSGSDPLRYPVLGVDLITNERVMALRRTDPAPMAVDAFRYQALELAPQPEPIVAPVPPPAAAEAEAEPEKEELRRRNEELSAAVSGFKDQLRAVNRRMRDLLQLEENSRIEARHLSLQLKLEKSRNQSTVMYQELEATRAKLAESRSREQELNRKLLGCLEKLGKLQDQAQLRLGNKGKRES